MDKYRYIGQAGGIGGGSTVDAVTGALLIARWRVLVIVVGTLWVGEIVLGLIATAVV